MSDNKDENNVISVGLVSLGCSKNLVDTQVMCGVLLTEGIELSSKPDDADVILVNTCAFIQAARDEAASEIVRACELKRLGRAGGVVVTGCLPQRYGQNLTKTFPDVDAWIGVDQLETIADVVKKIVARRSRRAIIKISSPATRLFEPRLPAFTLTPPYYAFLKIAEGCNHACSYCAIPQIRGHLRSRDVEDIVDDAFMLLCDGKKELNLVAQDTAAYGHECRDAPRLTDLLAALNSIQGRYWLRILYAYPSLVDDELLGAFGKYRHLCKYLDIPIQHSHPAILRAMRRADTIEAVQSLPARLRKACPSIVLRTTCMVGFPGETEEQFEHLCAYIQKARFDNLGVFVFSPEENTHAAKLPDQVPEDLAIRRKNKLLLIQRRVVRENNARRVGKIVEAILCERISSKRWLARSAWQAPEVDGVTFVKGVPPDAQVGDFVRVRITECKGCDFFAEIR